MQSFAKRFIRLSVSQASTINKYSFSESQAADSVAKEVLAKKPKAKPISTTPTVPTVPKKLKHVAIVLSGCGVYDGSEITEAVSFFIALSKRKIDFKCFSVDKDQTDVINHLTGQPLNEKRNTLIESSRIARGKVYDIANLSYNEFDAVFFPGGFGSAKNLSNLAMAGKEFTLDSQVERVLKEFHANKKVIGLACIAPMLAVKALGQKENKLHVTLGGKGEKWPYAGNIEIAEGLGAIHKNKPLTQALADTRNLVFTAPAFMKDTQDYSEVFGSIEALVQQVETSLETLQHEKEEKKDKKKEKKQIKKAAKAKSE